MLAAVGCVCFPALIYLLLNWGGQTHGWAVPIATDIAFALGIMSLLGDRVAPATKVFFSTLAIADDILAIIVIAVFYGQTPSVPWLAASLGCVVVLAALMLDSVVRAGSLEALGAVSTGFTAAAAAILLSFILSPAYLAFLRKRDENNRDVSGFALSMCAMLIALAVFAAIVVSKAVVF